MITEFGRQLRVIRARRDMTLGEMADKLDVSSAFLSAVENGKKSITDKLVKAIQLGFDLSDTEREEVFFSANRSKTEQKVQMENLSADTREIVGMFARSIESSSLSSEQAEKIRKILMGK